MSTHTTVDTLLAHLRDWWRARNELASIDQSERLAGLRANLV